MIRTMRFLVTLSILGSSLLFANPASAVEKSYLFYITNINGDRGIGRAAIDLSSRVDTLWEEDVEAYYDGGLTVSGDYIYWTYNQSIVRARVDGSGNKETIYTSDTDLSGITTFGDYLYWADLGRKAIGRSLLNGGSPEPDFIQNTPGGDGTSTNDSYGIYVNSEYIYWANYSSSTIGRANLNGTDRDSSFLILPNGSGPTSIWATSAKLIWTNYDAGTIGSSNIDGTNVNQDFISGGAGSTPYYLAVDSNSIYWSDFNSGTISKADLNGLNVIRTFLTVSGPVGIWIIHPSGGSGESDSRSSIEAAAKAAAQAAAAKREAEKRGARAEIVRKAIDKQTLSIDLFDKAEIPGITAGNLARAEAEIHALSDSSRSELSQILKIARKYEVVGLIGSDRVKSVYPNQYVEVGLISADSKIKSTLVKAVSNLADIQRNSYEAIKAAIEAKTAEFQVRKDRLAKVLAWSTTRNGK